MQKDVKTVAIGASLVGAYLLYKHINSQVKAAEQLSVNVVGLKFTSINILNTTLQIDLQVINNSNTTVRAQGLFGTITTPGGKQLGNFNVDLLGGQIMLKAAGTTNLSVSASISNITALAEIYGLITSGGKPQVNINATLVAGGLNFPFTYNVSTSGISGCRECMIM